MNWDWEKLQEKRQRQEGTPPPKEGPESGKPFNFDPGSFFAKGMRTGFPVWPVFAIGALLWLASGIFIVNPGEEAVVLRFGQYTRTVGGGPHYRMPFPFETHIVENTQMLRLVDVGVAEANLRAAQPIKVAQSSMFTGDENIVHMHFSVQYSISNLSKFLFKVKNPAAVIENAAEAAMREVVGNKKVESILTQGREEVQVRALAILEALLVSYDMGVRLHAVQLGDVYPPAEVRQAFIDVASAREAKVTIENQAEAYRAEIVPVATGTATSIVNGAKAYQQTVTKRAEGEAARFTVLAETFHKEEDATRKQLYLQAMEEIFASQGLEKVIFSKKVQGSVLPLFQVNPGGVKAVQEPAISASPKTPSGK